MRLGARRGRAAGCWSQRKSGPEPGAALARVSMDYRLRMAGDAEPGSGVVITLSTGF
jgi:hypothetical protein